MWRVRYLRSITHRCRTTIDPTRMERCMTEYVSDPNPGPLESEYLQQLRDLMASIRADKEAWATAPGVEEIRPGIYTIPYVFPERLSHQTLDWFYESKRVFWFDWPEWPEGTETLHNWTPGLAASLDHLTVRKYLTIIARADHFDQGIWEVNFERGTGLELFTRLYELEEQLVLDAANPPEG